MSLRYTSSFVHGEPLGSFSIALVGVTVEMERVHLDKPRRDGVGRPSNIAKLPSLLKGRGLAWRDFSFG